MSILQNILDVKIKWEKLIQTTFFCLIISITSLLTACKTMQAHRLVENITVRDQNVYYHINGLEKPFNVLFLADTHFTIEDERGREYYSYSRRMGGTAVEFENYGKSNGAERVLSASLDKAKKANSELVILGGDIINFPSLASVEYIKSLLDASGLNWVYVAGNHDWHYEGEPGSSYSLREKWINSNLKPLYQGRNPLYQSQVIHNINFVTIDNSIFEITEEQLLYFKKQIDKGLPIILSLHIPIYLTGHNIDYGCGNPNWNSENDTYYEIERREPWPEDGFTETTYQFRDMVLNSPEVIGVLAGHTHEDAADFYNNKLQYVVGANRSNKDVLIHFVPYN